MVGGGDVAAGLVGVAGVDRGLDQVQDHPSPRDAGAGGAKGIDLGDLQMSLLEVALSDGREASSRLGVGPGDLDAAWRGPGRGLFAAGQGEVHIAATSRGGCLQGANLSLPEVVAVGGGQVQPLIRQLPGLVPLSVHMGVVAEQHQSGNDHGDRTAVTFPVDHLPDHVAVARHRVHRYGREGQRDQLPGCGVGRQISKARARPARMSSEVWVGSTYAS